MRKATPSMRIQSFDEMKIVCQRPRVYQLKHEAKDKFVIAAAIGKYCAAFKSLQRPTSCMPP